MLQQGQYIQIAVAPTGVVKEGHRTRGSSQTMMVQCLWMRVSDAVGGCEPCMHVWHYHTASSDSFEARCVVKHRSGECTMGGGLHSVHQTSECKAWCQQGARPATGLSLGNM